MIRLSDLVMSYVFDDWYMNIVFSKNVTSGYRMSLVLWTILLCLLTRAIYVYPLLNLVNRYRSKVAIEKNQMDANLISMNTIHM